MSELFDGIERVVAKRDLASTNQPFLEGYFSGVDISKSTDYYLLTRNPAKLAKMWPEVAKHDGSEVINPKYRHNVIIGVPCKTQAEADRLMPELLKLSGLCRGLWVDLRGQTEEVDFSLIPINKDTTADVLTGVYTMSCDAGVDHPGAQQEFDGGPRISFVTCGGIDQPIHPQWLRTVRDQCKAAGVALYLDHKPGLRIDSDGRDVSDLPGLWDEPDTFGHQLDGVEHRQALTRGDA